MAWAARRLVRLGAVGVTLGVAAVAACTAFNDATVTGTPATDSGTDTFPGDSPPPPPPDALVETGADGSMVQSYLSTKDGATLCALVFSCPLLSTSIIESIGVPIDANNFSLCMDWASGPIPPGREGFTIQQQALQCMAMANTCIGAGKCNVLEQLTPGDSRCMVPADAATESGTYCIDDGGTKVDCVGLFAQHCTAADFTPGETCNLGTDGVAWCTVGGTDAGMCPPFSTCQTSFEDFCGTDMLHFSINCSTVGGLCGFDDAGYSNCGPKCPAINTGCAGTAVAVCDGQELNGFDCAGLGGTCDNMGNATHCKLPGDTCSPADGDVNVCTGTSIAVCVGGQKTSFDCQMIGKSCVQGTAPQGPHCG